MFNEKDHLASLRRAALMSVAITALVGLPSLAVAQDVETVPETVAVDDEEAEDNIVVTGSRARRDTFTSISPLQVITADTIRSAGLVDTGEILKQQTVVTGVQLDTNINSGFVTNGGPGASNVALRGLGADRTLVMVNGRRVAPSGVEGAPSLVDLNLIPSSMIARVDTLLDGAGSVYGSDAIAGVINLILRTDYEGVRVEAVGRNPFAGAAESGLASFLMGGQTGNGNYLFAAEYAIQTPLNMNDRDWTRSDAGIHCSLDIETDASGNTFRNCDGAVTNLEFRLRASPFATGAPFGGSGFNFLANTPNLSEINTAIARSFPLEGENDIINRTERFSGYFTANQGINVLGHNTNVFTELAYGNRQVQVRDGFHGQLFPSVPAANPFNIFPGIPLVPVISSPIKRSDIDTEVNQVRMLLGFNGELDFGRGTWDYELFGSYTRSQGYSNRPVVLEDRLALSLATTVQNPDGSFSCGNDLADLFGFITTATCVPVNLFAPSLYDPTGPTFATQAELDYLTGQRTATTFNQQKLFGGYITGDAFSVPAGDVSLVLGFEWREDSVDTRTDTIAATGGAAGFFSDKPSRGSVHLFELYGEAIIPLASGQTWFHDANIEIAGRMVDHQFYGTEGVYSAKANWAPTDFLNFRGTYGTSYRAPGLRELFLEGQSSFSSAADPCIVPLSARLDDDNDPLTPPVYDPTQDNRLPVILANCRSENVDPTTLGLTGSSSIEVFNAGNPRLEAETSTAITAGFSFDQPFTDRFDLRVGVNYFNTKVRNAAATPSANFILQQCYNSTDFPNDPFCQRRVRDPITRFLQTVDATPLNLGFFRSEGLDFNVSGSIDVNDVMGRDWTLGGDIQVTRQLASEFQNLATSPIGDNVGDFGTPKWRSVSNFRVITGDWTGFWRVVHIGKQEDINTLTGVVNPRTPDGRFAETTGLRTGSTSVVASLDDYFRHTASVRYQTDTWSVTAGLDNVFDVNPPLVDENTGATLGASNAPLGTGYDLLGRTVFINLVKEF